MGDVRFCTVMAVQEFNGNPIGYIIRIPNPATTSVLFTTAPPPLFSFSTLLTVPQLIYFSFLNIILDGEVSLCLMALSHMQIFVCAF